MDPNWVYGLKFCVAWKMLFRTAGSFETFSGMVLMSQLLIMPTPDCPWYCPSSSHPCANSHCRPPDQFKTYGMRILGSHQLADRVEKLVPINGTEPSGCRTYWNDSGPSDRRNT